MCVGGVGVGGRGGGVPSLSEIVSGNWRVGCGFRKKVGGGWKAPCMVRCGCKRAKSWSGGSGKGVEGHRRTKGVRVRLGHEQLDVGV